jgi:hypothetical protein
MIGSKAIEVYREVGIAGAWRLFSYAYKNHVRPFMPETDQINYAGVVVNQSL